MCGQPKRKNSTLDVVLDQSMVCLDGQHFCAVFYIAILFPVPQVILRAGVCPQSTPVYRNTEVERMFMCKFT